MTALVKKIVEKIFDTESCSCHCGDRATPKSIMSDNDHVHRIGKNYYGGKANIVCSQEQFIRHLQGQFPLLSDS